MGLGSTAKKVQVLADRAEQVYTQIMELREQIAELRETVDKTGQRVDELHVRSEKQWAVIQAMAEEQGVDVEQVLTEAAIEEVDVGGEETDAEAETDHAVEAEPDEEAA